jgi:hypothetical protein
LENLVVGKKPADLPVQQPASVALTLNLKTVKTNKADVACWPIASFRCDAEFDAIGA